MRIAITGGIGSGKSFVCRKLGERGISVYDCDSAAKRLMRSSPYIRSALCRLVGDDVYSGDMLQKRVLATFLLASDSNRIAVNDIVHPAVAADFVASGLTWLESAILFDSGFDKRVAFDHTICVCAPLHTRIARVMARDGISSAKALEWIGQQLPQADMASRCDYVIHNDGTSDLDSQIDDMLAPLHK